MTRFHLITQDVVTLLTKWFRLYLFNFSRINFVVVLLDKKGFVFFIWSLVFCRYIFAMEFEGSSRDSNNIESRVVSRRLAWLAVGTKITRSHGDKSAQCIMDMATQQLERGSASRRGNVSEWIFSLKHPWHLQVPIIFSPYEALSIHFSGV